MTEFAKMDIFFFVSTLGVVIVTAMLLILLAYIIDAVKVMKAILEKVKMEAGYLSDDIEELREKVHEKGFRLRHGVKFFNRLYKRYKYEK